MALALKAAHKRGNQRHRRGIAIEKIASLGNVACNPLGFLHGRASRRQIILLAVARRKLVQFLDGGSQIIGLAGCSLHLFPVLFQGPFGLFPCPVKRAKIIGTVGQSAKSIQKRAVRIGIHQRTVIMLAVDFHQKLARLPHELHTDRLVVDRGLGPSVGRLHPAENQVAILIKIAVPEQLAHLVIGTHIKHGGYLPLVLPVPHKRPVTPATKGQ